LNAAFTTPQGESRGRHRRPKASRGCREQFWKSSQILSGSEIRNASEKACQKTLGRSPAGHSSARSSPRSVFACSRPNAKALLSGPLSTEIVLIFDLLNKKIEVLKLSHFGEVVEKGHVGWPRQVHDLHKS
jgi:hypothetical protein